MSTQVDSRVVEMHFDNEQFMSKIQETISALERLNAQIDSINMARGINLNTGTTVDNLSNVESSVSNIENRFSTLGIVGMTIIERLTNAGINMGLKLEHGLTSVFRQIEQGGMRRAENLEQANFLLEGLGANVTSVMKDVNYAVEGTAYGLDEAAKSAAVFYAAGVTDSDKMRTALRSISGVAAMAGKSYSEMADVFQDTAGKGIFQTQELRRIQQQGIAADQYLLKYINDVNAGEKEASESVKKTIQEITGGAQITMDMLTGDKGLLSQGAITFDLFAEAMDDAFGEHATKANETFSGSLANVKTALSRLGEAFITPAMQGAIPIFNSLQGAIKSIMSTLKAQGGAIYEYSFAIKTVGKSISNAIDKANELMIFAEIGRIIASSIRIIIEILSLLKGAFKDVFPDATAKNLASIVHSIADLASKAAAFKRVGKVVSGNTKPLVTLSQAFYAFFYILKIVINLLSGVFKVFKSFIGIIGVIIERTVGLRYNFIWLLEALADKTDKMTFFDALADSVGEAKTTVEGAVDSVSNAVFEIIDVIENRLGKTIRKFVSFVGDCISDFLDEINKASNGVVDFSNAFTAVGAVYAGLFVFRKIGLMIQPIFNNFAAIFHPKTGLIAMMGSVVNIPGKLSSMIGTLTDTLKAMQYEIDSKIIKNLAVSILLLAVALKVMESIEVEKLKITLSAVTYLFSNMAAMLVAIKQMSTLASKDGGFSGIFAIGSLSNALVKIAASLLIVSIALKVLSTLEVEELERGLFAFSIILGSMLGFISGAGKLLNPKTAESIAVVSDAMIAMSIAMNLLARAVERFGEMDPETLLQGMFVLTILLAEISAFSKGFTTKLSEKGGNGIVQAGISMILMATALNILAPALEKIGSMPIENIAKGLGAITAVIFLLSGQSGDMKDMTGIMSIAAGIFILATAFEKLGNMKLAQLGKALGTVAIALGIFLAAATILGLNPEIAIAFELLSKNMLLLGASIALVGVGLVLIGAGLTSMAAGILALASISVTAAKAFAELFVIIVASVVRVLPTIAIEIAKAIVEFLQTLADLAPKLEESFTKLITVGIQAFMNNVPRLIVLGVKFIYWFLKGMAEATPKLIEQGVLIIVGVIEGITKGMEQLVEAGIELMLSFINGLANGIREHKEDIRNAIWNMCEAILEAFCAFFGIASPSKVMEEQGGNLIIGLINGIKNFAGNVKEAFINAVKKAYDKIKEFVSNFKEAGSKLITKFISGIKEHAGDIWAKIKEAVSKAKDKVVEYAEKFADAGKDLVKGIASGIKNAVKHVIKAIKSVAGSALETFKEKLGIASPSKEFAKLGIRIPEGAAKGINKGTHFLKTAVGDMSNRALDSMSEAIKDINDAINIGDNFNPIITPVLDLDKFSKDAKSIDDLLSDKSVHAAYSAGNVNETMLNNRQLYDILNKLQDKVTTNQPASNITNNITVDGSENPEAFANRFVDQLKMQMRTT